METKMKKSNTKLFYMAFNIFFCLCLQPESIFAKTCVLSLFQINSWEDQKINHLFMYYIEASLFRQAQLADITYCFTSGEFDEIVWVSHGSRVGTENNVYSAPILFRNDGSKIGLPVRYFETLISKISPQVVKLRLNLCGIDEKLNLNRINSTIDFLVKDLLNRNKEVEISPLSKFASKILGEKVTSLNIEWLALSIQEEHAKYFAHWKTNSNRYCKKDFWSGCDREKSRVVIPLSMERTNN